jgi:glycosyltransferase involved in cell wall biosynthesis
MKIAYIVTVPHAAKSFLRGQLSYFAKAGNEVRLFASGEPLIEEVAQSEGVSAEPLPLKREMSPLADAYALWRTWRALRRFRPDIINFGMPKAGIVGGLAAVLARVPARIYVLHGLRLETAKGVEAIILSATERLACASAHRVLCVSPSLREEAVRLGLAPADKLRVLESGSANGVDFARFATPPGDLQKKQLQRELGIESHMTIVGFIGRFTTDKGVTELVQAFDRLEALRPDVRLLMIGQFEGLDPLPAETRARVEARYKIIWVPFVPDPAPYYHLMDIFVLPTRREGMGMVCLEAAAAGLPVVSTQATGARDAVLDGVTGRLIPVGDVAALEEAIREFIDDPAHARTLGKAGQKRVRSEFSPQRIWAALEDLYHEVLQSRAPRWRRFKGS